MRFALPPMVGLIWTLVGSPAWSDHFATRASPWDGKWTVELEIDGGGPCGGNWPPISLEIVSGVATGWYSEPTYGGWQYMVNLDAQGRAENMFLAGIVVFDFSGRFVDDRGEGTLHGGLEGYNCRGDWVARRATAGGGSDAAPARSVEERLGRVRDLLRRGLITADEAEAKRREILDDL